MQNILFPFILSTLAGLSTLVGAVFIFFKINKKNLNKFITFCLSFSLSVMISISIFDLIPVSFFEITKVYGVGKGIFLLAIAFLVSYIFITLITDLSKEKFKVADFEALMV